MIEVAALLLVVAAGLVAIAFLDQREERRRLDRLRDLEEAAYRARLARRRREWSRG